MILGRYGDTTGRPYIQARVKVLERYVDVSFLVDTGADATVLSPADAGRLGHSSEMFGPRNLVVGGIGDCQALCAVVDALVIFNGETRAQVYAVDLVVGFADDMREDLPSLLGRDVLDRWLLTYNPTASRLAAEVLDTDWSFPYEA